jgi:hypothetical protein
MLLCTPALRRAVMDTSPRDHSQGLLDLDMGKTVYTPQIPTRVCGRARSPRSPGAWYLLNDKMDLDANWRAPFFSNAPAEQNSDPSK